MVKFDYSVMNIEVKSFSKIIFDRNVIYDRLKLIYMHNLRLLKQNILLLQESYQFLYSTIYLNKIKTCHVLISKYHLCNLLIKLKILLKKHSLIKWINNYSFNRVTITTSPTKFKNINLLKSPHVFKNAQSHYEYRVYKLGINLPLVVDADLNHNYVNSLIEKTMKFDSNYKIKIKRKKTLLLNNSGIINK